MRSTSGCSMRTAAGSPCTVLEHYADRGDIDPAVITPVVSDIGEALVIKHQIDTGELPTEDYREAIVDQAILPALGLSHLSKGAA